MATNARNIIIGVHLLDPDLSAKVPGSSILLNTEQIGDEVAQWTARVVRWASQFETWDYSERNIECLRRLGAKDVKLLRIGFHEKLARIARSPAQDIDVLFYGAINDRRWSVLEALKQSGFQVTAVFGVYGEARDLMIARSKLVLNVHQFDAQVFEIVRVFYLMTNSKAVVAEVGEATLIDSAYLEGIFPATYDKIVESCKRLLQDTELRQELEARALRTIMQLPQRELIAPLLG